jgi:hypothetical protein
MTIVRDLSGLDEIPSVMLAATIGLMSAVAHVLSGEELRDVFADAGVQRMMKIAISSGDDQARREVAEIMEDVRVKS